VTLAQLAVTVVGVAGIVWVLWYFLFSKGRAVAASSRNGTQEIRVVVKGGYTPDTVVVEAGKPVRLQFYRDETADCSERVVFPDFDVDVTLPAFETTTIEFTPPEAGEFSFRCGMNMLKGLLVVEPANRDRRPTASPHTLHQHPTP